MREIADLCPSESASSRVIAASTLAENHEHGLSEARKAAAGDSFELWGRKRLVTRSEDSSH